MVGNAACKDKCTLLAVYIVCLIQQYTFTFASNGMVLPAGQNGGLPVVTVNVPEVDVQFLKVRKEQLPRFLDMVMNGPSKKAKKAAAVQTEAQNAQLEKRLQDAETQINQARSSAMTALRQVATETAATVVTRLTGVAADAARLNGAIGSALASRGLG